MLNKIKSFFEENFLTSAGIEDVEHQLKLATAALLIEMMAQDHEVHDAEKEAVLKALKEKFQLSDDETKALYELADSTDYHQFTTLIAEHYSQEKKIKIIEYLWFIAYADQSLDKYEEHMIRRISDLIFVPHKEFIKAKHRVQEELGVV